MANRMISYGYGMESGKLVVIDSEAEIVCRVFREYIKGKLLQEVADELTEEGVGFYLENRLWNKNKVFCIVENEKYIGADGYPAIIGLEEYQKANQRKSARGNLCCKQGKMHKPIIPRRRSCVIQMKSAE